MKTIVLLEVALAVAASAANYSARQDTRDGVDVVVLADSARHTEVTILPSIGNMAYRMKVNGKDVLNAPAGRPGQVQGQSGQDGNPAPVALGQPPRPGLLLCERQVICAEPGTGQRFHGSEQKAGPRPAEDLFRVEGGVVQGGRPGG